MDHDQYKSRTASPSPPGTPDVSEYFPKPEPNPSCCCSIAPNVPGQISSADQAEAFSAAKEYIPLSGRHIVYVDHRNRRCLINGYQLPLSEIIVPSMHSKKLPLDPEQKLEMDLDFLMETTEEKS